MKKFLPIIMLIGICLGLCACTNNQQPPEETLPPESIIWGAWEGELAGVNIMFVFHNNNTYSTYIQIAEASGNNGTYNYDSLESTITLDSGRSIPVVVSDTSLMLFYGGEDDPPTAILTKVDYT